jgi:hypothetical protein
VRHSNGVSVDTRQGTRVLRRIAGFVMMPLVVSCALAESTVPTREEPLTDDRERPRRFQWGAALTQSFLFLTVEHSMRLTQPKTRAQFEGKFVKDYWACIKNIRGWGDGDGAFTNYVAHPMQGGVAGLIYVQNDPEGVRREFGRDPGYWRSRMRAMGWAAAYSTQFEIGPISEATIGHVGKQKGTAGYTDLVVTPVGGVGMMILEDAVDRFVISRLESRGLSRGWQRFLRVALNPQRGLANLLRFSRPWRRDVRQLSGTQH